jgi:hypothetical protein
MISRRTKDKFRKDNYRIIAKKVKNLSAAEADWKNESIDAIRDLTLFANKLPNDIQKDIFQYENIRKFAQAILKGNEKGMYSYSKSKDRIVFNRQNRDYDKEFDKRVTQIAACLVTEGIKVCVEYYEKYLGTDFMLDEPLIENLNNVAKRCSAMVFKIVYDTGQMSFPVPKWHVEDVEK